MKPEKDNTFCYYPFTQLALKEWQSSRGIISASPCCNAIRPETPDPLNIKSTLSKEKMLPNDIFHSNQMDEIREYMLAGKRHDACTTCWKIENDGGKSYRLFSRPPTAELGFDDFDENKPKLQSVDFGFGENCNLRCRMCMPGLSNKLSHDYKFFVNNDINTENISGWDWKKEQHEQRPGKFYLNTRNNSQNLVEFFDTGEQWQDILKNIHNLRAIKATGGETTLTSGFKEFLDTAIKTKACEKIFLEFHTNATKFTNTLIDKLFHFPACRMNFSIDSVGKNYEYIRYPMKFETLESSINNLFSKLTLQKYSSTKKTIKLQIVLVSVFSIYNAHYLYDLYNWWKENIRPRVKKSSLYIDKLWPDDKFTSVKFLAKKQKLEILDILYKIQNEGIVDVDNIIKHVKAELDKKVTDNDRKNMLKEITAFDKSRNQSYRDFLHPSIIEYLETPIEV